MLSRLLLFAFFLLAGNLHAVDDKDLPPDEFTVKRFLISLAAKDEKALREICVFNESLAALWAGTPPGKEKLAEIVDAIRREPIKWLAAGDSFRLNNAELTVTDAMIGDKKRIATFRLHDFSFPIFIRKTPRNEWKVDPSIVITLTLDRLRKEEKAHRKNFTLSLDGKDTPFNLGEEVEVTLADGRKMKARIQQNLFQNHEDAEIRLLYPRELDLNVIRDKDPDQNRDCTVYRFSGALSANFMVQIHRHSKLEEVRKDISDAFVENNRTGAWYLDKDIFHDCKIDGPNGILAGKRIGATKNPQSKLPEKIEELYFWETGDGRVICLYGTWNYQDTSACRDWFAALAKGIEVKAAAKVETQAAVPEKKP